MNNLIQVTAIAESHNGEIVRNSKRDKLQINVDLILALLSDGSIIFKETRSSSMVIGKTRYEKFKIYSDNT